MTVRLRPHHLLCLLTYVGRGYSAAFTANYDAIAKRLSGGEGIEIVAGPDDICAPLLSEPEPHCWRDSVVERDRLAALDLEALLGQPLPAGAAVVLTEERLRLMRTAFASGKPRAACSGCEWHDLCSVIAAGGYREVKVGGASLS